VTQILSEVPLRPGPADVLPPASSLNGTGGHFPHNFTWGAAAAAYQIEGGWDADGKGLSIWDMLCRQPGRVWEGHTGNVACDHYKHYREDVALMAQIGLKAYRFSISWPRVMPQGTGAVNQAGLDFYDRLVDELMARGIEPWVTLFHWDFPYELYLRGGWLNSDSPHWFAEYAAVVVDRLSDRVSHWMTLNEPQCFIQLGHINGDHAPGIKLGLHEGLRAAHHVLLAHGRSVQVIRARAQGPAQVGWAPVGYVCYPESESADDIAAARRATFAIDAGTLWNNSWWGDPVILGRYPEEGLRAYGGAVPRFPSSDMDIIRQPLDFYGCNTYSGVPLRMGDDGLGRVADMTPGHPHTLSLWKQTPAALYWGPRFLAEQYGLPVVITENGLSTCDWVGLDGRVHDGARIDFINRYLLEVARAIADGVDVRGYFVWSILDNFEWSDGYKQRFGLIHVDYGTQKRTLKESAHWYRDVIRSHGSVLSRHVASH
jgi:beta-glucosidase